VPDRANATTDFVILPQSTGTDLLTPSTPPIVVDRVRSYERVLRGYFSGVDGGEHIENYMRRNDWSYSGLLLGAARFGIQDALDVTHLELDSSGTGLPDWWLLENGLDPGSNDSENGPHGDPDGDGLPNIAEFLAGTDPLNWDSAGDGFSDFDSYVPGTDITYGFLFTDNDGMSDLWESQYPGIVSPSVYDAHLDPDGDGWSNFAEFMYGSDLGDPTDLPRPKMNVRFLYSGALSQGPIRINFYDSASMDGPPMAIGTAGASLIAPRTIVGEVQENRQFASGTMTLVPVVPGTVSIEAPGNIRFVDLGNGVLRSENVSPIRFGQIDYQSGNWSINLAPSLFQPGSTVSASWNYFVGVSGFPFDGVMSIIEGHLRQGPVWAFAFIDRDGTGDWSPGDPAGIAQGQPINVSWGEIPTVEFGLTDELPGYHRFAWDPVSGVSRYKVEVGMISGDQSRSITRTIHNRTYFHEGDFQLEQWFGIPWGTLQWRVSINGSPITNGLYNADYADQLNRPVIHAPAGDVKFARNEFVWSMDKDVTEVRIQIRAESAAGPVIYDQRLPVPHRESNGRYRLDFPLYAGDALLPNGNYVWRVQAINPRLPSTANHFSQYQQFRVSLAPNAVGAQFISGDIVYRGPTDADNIVVQAFRSPGFSGRPDAQVTLNGPGPYTLMGLRPGTYYVRAFINQNPATLRNWESWGFVRDYENGSDYKINPIDVPGNKSGQRILIRDRDTNNNGIPDSLEYQTFGTLNYTQAQLNALPDNHIVKQWIAWRAAAADLMAGVDDNVNEAVDAFIEALGLTRDQWFGRSYAPARRSIEAVLGPNPPTLDLFQMRVEPGPQGDEISYSISLGIERLLTNVPVRIQVSTNLIHGFETLTGSENVIQKDSWRDMEWFYINTNIAPMQIYRIDWDL
jgi:hypothetical protein